MLYMLYIRFVLQANSLIHYALQEYIFHRKFARSSILKTRVNRYMRCKE